MLTISKYLDDFKNDGKCLDYELMTIGDNSKFVKYKLAITTKFENRKNRKFWEYTPKEDVYTDRSNNFYKMLDSTNKSWEELVRDIFKISLWTTKYVPHSNTRYKKEQKPNADLCTLQNSSSTKNPRTYSRTQPYAIDNETPKSNLQREKVAYAIKELNRRFLNTGQWIKDKYSDLTGDHKRILNSVYNYLIPNVNNEGLKCKRYPDDHYSLLFRKFSNHTADNLIRIINRMIIGTKNGGAERHGYEMKMMKIKDFWENVSRDDDDYYENYYSRNAVDKMNGIIDADELRIKRIEIDE